MSGTVAEPADDRVRFTVASDPMMGLAWECEPVLRRLETHFAGRIEIRHAMSVLVRDVADFVDPDDLALGLPEAIRRYLLRLAAIARLSDGALRPEPPEATPAALAALLARRPALHTEEIRTAFGVESPAALRELVRPLVLDGTALVREASRGWFLERRAGLAAGVGVC